MSKKSPLGAKCKSFCAHQQASKVIVMGIFWGGDFNLFCSRSKPKHEPTPKSASKFDTVVPFFYTLDFEPP